MTSEILSDTITNIFTFILNILFSTGIFTDSENYTVLKPLLKAGKDEDEHSSFRPLYNTSILIGFQKTACLKQFNDYLSKMPALQKLPSAFRRNHSFETIVTKVYNDFINIKNRDKDTTLVLQDLIAAFDTVDQDILLKDLLPLGIYGIVFEWFKNISVEQKFHGVCQ